MLHTSTKIGEAGSSFQTKTPAPRVEGIEFRIQVGRCWCSRRRCMVGIRGSAFRIALGGAASQVGPQAPVLAMFLSKDFKYMLSVSLFGDQKLK